MLKPQIAGEDFDFGTSPLDWRVCNEVLKGNCYPFVPMTGEVKTIVDIGAHLGASVRLFAKRYPGAHIFAFEPHPENFKRLKANTAHIDDQVSVYQMALSDGDGHANLWEGHQAGACNSFYQSGTTGDRCVSIAIRDAHAALLELGVKELDILKIDTEGCEAPILDSLYQDHLLGETGMIYLEFHSAEDRIYIDSLLSLFGFVLYYGKIEGPDRGQLCYVNNERLPESARDFCIKKEIRPCP